MLSLTPYPDGITRLQLSTRRSRLVGYAVSAYLVRGVLVDTGFARVARRVTRYLDAARVRAAAVTHWHEDHAGNVALLAARGVSLAMGAETRARLERPLPLELYRRAIWGTPAPLVAASDPGAAAARAAAALAEAGLALVATPGHTSDHHALWDAERATLFAGDLFLGVQVRVAHVAERPRATLASVRAVGALAPARLFCAHRGAVSTPTAALWAKAEWMAATIGRVEDRIAAGWSDRAICDEVLGGESATGYVTRGEYARINFVRAVRSEGETGGGC